MDYWKVIQGMNARNKHLDIYNNKFLFTASGRTIKLVDFSGGEVMSQTLKELESDIKFIAISQESSRRLPKVFILTEKYDILFYTLKVTRTTARNKINYEMVSRYEFNLLLINPIETWPENFQMSKRQFVAFEVRESKNFIFFLLVDSMGNI